ncbi:MAG: DNA polymerase sliding clamp [Desulfurococcaceae archaeon]
MRIVLPEAKMFKEIIEATGNIADEVAFKISPEGFTLKALDIDQSSFLEVFFPPDLFLEFNVEKEFIIGVSIANLKRVLKFIKKGDNLVMGLEGDYVRFEIESIVKRRFGFRNLDVQVPEIPETAFQYNVSAQLMSAAVKKAIEDVKSIGGVVEFDTPSKELFVIRAVGTGKMEAKFAMGSTAVISLEISELSRASYDAGKLSNILDIAKVSDIVKIQFSSKMPLRMEFLVGNGKVAYLLAPFEAG